MNPDKISKIRFALKESGIDSLFVSCQENVVYLTGIIGLNTGQREAFLFITGAEVYLLAFSTTFLSYQHLPNINKVELTVNFRLHQALNNIIKQNKLKKIGFESDFMTYGEVGSLKQKLNAALIPTSGIIENFRLVKSDEEIANIKKAAQITDKAFSYILTEIKPGVSEKLLALKIEHFIKNHAQNISFFPIVAFNQNSAIPHYLPSDKISLKKNSVVLLDFGAKYENYCSDMTRVVFFGPPQDKIIKIFTTVKKAQELALNSVKTGISGHSIDKISREFIDKTGYPAYSHGLGHGVGLAIHENPRLRPNISNKLEQGMVFTIEPGIYIPGFAGVRIEDLLVLRKDGPEILSKSTKEIIIL